MAHNDCVSIHNATHTPHGGIMRSISNLFGPNPFVAIQTHMTIVAESVEKGDQAIQAWLEGDTAKVESLSEAIRQLETQAGRTRSDINKTLAKGFLSVDRTRLRNVLSRQDGIAGTMQDLAALLTLMPMRTEPAFLDLFKEFVTLNHHIFDDSRRVIMEFDDLQESTFGGAEAVSVKGMAKDISKLESDADAAQHKLLKTLLVNDEQMSHGEFFLWTRLLKVISDLGNRSNRLSKRVKSMLDLE